MCVCACVCASYQTENILSDVFTKQENNPPDSTRTDREYLSRLPCNKQNIPPDLSVANAISFQTSMTEGRLPGNKQRIFIGNSREILPDVPHKPRMSSRLLRNKKNILPHFPVRNRISLIIIIIIMRVIMITIIAFLERLVM